MDREGRRRAADENVAVAFGLVRDHYGDPRAGGARFGRVEAIATGVESAFFNMALVLDPAANPADVIAAADWVEGRGLPVSIHVRDDVGPDVEASLRERGFHAEAWSTPVMVLEPIPTVPVPNLDGVTLRAGGAELNDDLHAALESGDAFRRMFGPALLSDPSVRIAIAYLRGEPVAAAVAIRSGVVAGIYVVWTQERARRRGIGRAVTWAAIEAGRRAWNVTIAILQSSEMGLPVYRSMGFEEVARYAAYLKLPAASPVGGERSSTDP